MLDPQEWSAAQLAAGRPAFLGSCQAAQQGFFAGADPLLGTLLGTLLGREPRSVRQVVESALSPVTPARG